MTTFAPKTDKSFSIAAAVHFLCLAGPVAPIVSPSLHLQARCWFRVLTYTYSKKNLHPLTSSRSLLISLLPLQAVPPSDYEAVYNLSLGTASTVKLGCIDRKSVTAQYVIPHWASDPSASCVELGLTIVTDALHNYRSYTRSGQPAVGAEEPWHCLSAKSTKLPSVVLRLPGDVAYMDGCQDLEIPKGTMLP